MCSDSNTAGCLGDGRDGDLVSAGTLEPVNACYVLESSDVGSITVPDAPEFPAGTLLLLHQVTDDFATSGDQASVTSPGLAGRWQMVRVTIQNGNVVGVFPDVLHSFHSALTVRAQVCVVKQYSNVTLGNDVQLVAENWNGQVGGVLAMVVTGDVALGANSRISASQKGYPGGLANGAGDNVFDVVMQDTTADNGGDKGAGLDGRSAALHGAGNMANAAGGGNAHNAGGGGGGNAGKGGMGGKQVAGQGDVAGTAGKGGARVTATSLERLVMGGGGAGAHENDGLGGDGGNGGGVVLVLAGSIIGTGAFVASGGNGGSSNLDVDKVDGAGGGGAGGTIIVVAATATFTGVVQAKGGRGGSVDVGQYDANSRHGPGGGGGGGRVLSRGLNATVDVTGGTSGTVDYSSGVGPWGATDGEAGVTE